MTDPLAQIAALFGPYAEQVKPLLPGATMVLGVASLGWGASVWRWVRVASGLLVGVIGGAAVGAQVHDARVGLIAAGIMAIGVAVAFYLTERLAVGTLGAGVAVLLAEVSWPLTHGGAPATSMVEGVAALLGGTLAAFVHQSVIKGVTAMFGALLLLRAVGYGDKLQHVLILGALGWAFQMWGGRGGSAAPVKRARSGKGA